MAMMQTSGAHPKLWLFRLRWKLSISSSLSRAMVVKVYTPNWTARARSTAAHSLSMQSTNCFSSYVLFWSVVTRPAKDPTWWRINTTILLLIVEFVLMGGQRGIAQLLFLLYFGWGQEGWQSRERIAWRSGILDQPQPLLESGLLRA